MENPFSNVPPVEVLYKGTGDGNSKPLVDGQIIKTPDHLPDIKVKIFKPIRSLLLTFFADYGKAFSGLVTAAITPVGGKLLYTSDVWHMIVTCASLALAGPLVTLVTNISMILNTLKEKYPLIMNFGKGD